MAGKVQPAVFELSFKADQPAELDETDVAYVEEGHPFRIQCVADKSYTDQLFVKKRNEEHLHKKEYVDEAFEHAADGGVYECEARPVSSKDQIHLRRIHIMPRHIMPRIFLNLPQCSHSEKAFCGPSGACAMVNSKPTCFRPGITGPPGCPPGFVGEKCELNLVTEYFKSLSANTVTVAAGAGGTLTAALIIVIAILGFVFIKEKRKTRQMMKIFGPLPERNAYGESVPRYPENPYKKISADNLHEPRRMDSPRNAFRSPKARPLEDRVQLPLIDSSRLQEIPSIS